MVLMLSNNYSVNLKSKMSNVSKWYHIIVNSYYHQLQNERWRSSKVKK